MSELNQRFLAALGELADEPVEQTGPTSDFVYVDISSIDRESKKITEAKPLTLSQAPSRAKQLLRAGDVLVSMTRPNLNAVALVPEQLDGAIGSTGFHVLRSRWLRPEFLLRLVQSQRFVDEMSALVQGALYPAVRPKDIAAFTFVFETPAQQSRIAAKLEELLSDLDAGVAELKAAQKKLAQYRQSLLKAAVEGVLTAEWRAKNTPSETGAQLLQRILTERRARWEARQLARFAEQGKTPPKGWQNKYPEPVQPDTIGLPELPQGWVWASGEQICDFITKGTTPPKELDPRGQKTIPFLRVTNLTNRGELDLSDEVFVSVETHRGFLARSAVYPNDVLMNIVGPPLGQVAVVPPTFAEWNINQAIAIFRSVEGVLPSFICRYLLSPVAQKWLKSRSKTTAGQTNLTLEVCRSLPFPLPPKDEQQELLGSIETAMTALSSQEQTIDHALQQSVAQRQNILRAAFAGQLVPQDLNDEPAAVLLARIRAGRAAQAAMKTPRGGKPRERRS
ncbi:restriction endonuclease subunit S [Extensimonas sp. H3M7-6]|uniref:restriction endonuclease subunit S n=1 Tax=Extensimonas soli TaxID=3031322 RepID=UPI0023DBDA31|nr:restriction endonuclease subunit S [Extensimonas sp. H3M7-6]MDF1483406.1 restriction endonuclease subunit S [Extensimonas sp. H3M7-6]